MKNILVLDVGNSTYHAVVYREDKTILFNHRISSIREGSLVEAYFKSLKQQCTDQIDLVVISSVIPFMTDQIMRIAQKMYQTEVIRCDVMSQQLSTCLDHPMELGDDFVASAISVMKQYPQPAIIIDLGTANKISVIQNNQFLGGIIQPGLKQQFDSYRGILSHLPEVEMSLPSSLIGHNTVECIQSGIIHGTFLGLFAITKEIEKELNQICSVIVTGGNATVYPQQSNFIYDPLLVTDGLYYVGIQYLNK